MDVLVHIDNTTQEQLQHHATRAGRTFDEYVSALLREYAAHPPLTFESSPDADEERLLSEYRELTALKHQGTLTSGQQIRLVEVEAVLDDIDDQSVGAQYMRGQVNLIQSTLDRILSTVEALPAVAE